MPPPLSFPRRSYSDEELVKLIQLVKEHPGLYNKRHPRYRKHYNDADWNAIGQEMGWNPGRCKERWRTMRDAFKRNLNLKRLNTHKNSKYQVYPLEFLIEHVTDQHGSKTPDGEGFLSANNPTPVKLELLSPGNNDNSTSEDYILPEPNEDICEQIAEESGCQFTEEIAQQIADNFASEDADGTAESAQVQQQQLPPPPPAPPQSSISTTTTTNNNRIVVVTRTPPTTAATQPPPPFVVVGSGDLPTTTPQRPLLVMTNGSTASNHQFVMMNGLPTARPPGKIVVVEQQKKTNNTQPAPSPSTPAPKKRKRVEASSDIDSEDPVDTFFRSMAQTVKKFPPLKVAEVKLEVCKLVTRLECQLIRGQMDELAFSVDCDSASEPKET